MIIIYCESFLKVRSLHKLSKKTMKKEIVIIKEPKTIIYRYDINCNLCKEKYRVDQETHICTYCFIQYQKVLCKTESLIFCSCIDEFFPCNDCAKKISYIYDYISPNSNFYVIPSKNLYFHFSDSPFACYILDSNEIKELQQFEKKFKKIEGIEKILIIKMIEYYLIKQIYLTAKTERKIKTWNSLLKEANLFNVWSFLPLP
jgi:hypothetical protein